MTHCISGTLALAVATHLETAIEFAPLAIGSQAACFAVRTAGSTESDSVLKTFHADYTLATPEYVVREFNALTAFALVNVERRDFGCPTPMAVFATERAYLMSRIDGEPLADLLDAGVISAATLSDVRQRLLLALASFHEATGECFGDFHPQNILVTPDAGQGWRLTLIDPCMANDAFYEPSSWARCAPLSVDLAYWLFSECGRQCRLGLGHPRAAARRLLFAREMIRDASRAFTVGELELDVVDLVRWHARRFRAMRSVRLSVIAMTASVLARWACRY